jgi:hypothetical protein
MRPYTKTYSPVTAATAGFATGVTGATFTLTTLATPDGLAHQVTILNNTATDHSAKTITIVGTDADGTSITETLAAPAGSVSVTSVKYYATLVSVTPSATIGADTFNIGYAAVSLSRTFVLNRRAGVNVATVSAVVTGTVNFTGQELFTGPQDYVNPPCNSQTWFDMSGMTSKTASTTSTNTTNAQATRIKINSVTNGATIALSILEGVEIN